MSEQSRRLWLDVPANEGDQAKAKGAIFDSARNSWYITEEVSEERFEDFEQWYQPEPYTHMVFDGIYIMEGNLQCPHCHQTTSVVCLFTTDAAMINEGLEPWPEDTDKFSYVFNFVGEVSPSVAKELEHRFPLFKKDKEKPHHRSAKYMNHCSHCQAAISEKLVHYRSGQFHPENGSFSGIQLHKLAVELPVKLAGGAGGFWKSDSSNNHDVFGELINAAK